MDKHAVISNHELGVPKGYALSSCEFFREKDLLAIGKCLMNSMKRSMEDIEKKLAASPSIVNAISS